MLTIRCLYLLFVLLVSGCATSFPVAEPELEFDDGLDAAALLDLTVKAHGGDLRDDTGTFTLAMEGDWKRLIVRIQPVVTDAGYRISAVERYTPKDRRYEVQHQGPDGTKTVIRQGRGIELYYNGEPETDPARLRATAMTTDAFELFHFGPTFILHRQSALTRLSDQRENGVNYRRLLATLRPGFGEAEEDQVVLWIDPDFHLLFRVHLTLNGFETTQGAHVDTTFLAYEQVGDYVFPTQFEERVRGPLRIHAHDWRITEFAYEAPE